MTSEAIKQKKKKKTYDKDMIKYIGKMIAMTAKMQPFQFWINIPASLLHSLSFILIMLASEQFFNTVASLSKGQATNNVVNTIIVLGLAYLLNQTINGIHNFMYSIRSTRLIGILKDKMHIKSSAVPAIAYEDPEFLDGLEKAKKGTDVSIFASDLVIVLLTFYVPYFIFMGIYLGSRSKILLLSLILVFAPTLLGQYLRMRLFKAKEDRVAPLRREMEDREKAICDRQYFKETRLLGGFSYMQSLYQKVLKDLKHEHWETEKKSLIQLVLLNSITVIGYLSILCMLVFLCVRQEISIGSFVAVFNSLGIMFNLSEEIISVHIGSIAKDVAHIQNLVKFLNSSEKSGDSGKFDESSDIVLKNVEFKYPGAKSNALNNVSLSIKQGEIVAIVGDNGAGKSTLVKLMAGMYKPNKGTVSVGGMDTLETDPVHIYKGISAVFQKYNCYQMTLKENVEISDFEVSESDKNERLEKAVNEAELDLSERTFSSGLDTMLSREFDGVDLSGGQWQRVAISRGLYRENSIIFLDEPTKAIDPVEETRLYKQFAKISKGKTSLIVTHRLGSTRIADRIIVMKDGCVNDIGTYDELMSRGGEYAKMYKSQAQWYES